VPILKSGGEEKEKPNYPEEVIRGKGGKEYHKENLRTFGKRNSALWSKKPHP